MDRAFGSGPKGCGFDSRKAQKMVDGRKLDFAGFLAVGLYNL